MFGSERNNCCDLVLAMFMLSFRFREEPIMSIGVGGLRRVLHLFCCIHASCILEIGDGLRSSEESQVQRGTCDESVCSGMETSSERKQ